MRHHSKRGIAGAVTAIMLAFPVAVVATATPASAASCFGAYCEGQDPVDTGCSADAVTVATAAITNSSGNVIGRVDLRWSNSCETNWTRTVSYIGGQQLVAQSIALSDQYSTYEDLIGVSTIWTNMIYGLDECVYGEGEIWVPSGFGWWDEAGAATTASVC
jgi:hypothetical protein